MVENEVTLSRNLALTLRSPLPVHLEGRGNRTDDYT